MLISSRNCNEQVFIIAEIGNNHEGSYTLAEEMIGLAAEAGADAVKFQTIIPERLVSIQLTERIKQLNRFQLSYNEFKKLAEVAKKEGVIFLSTPFDLDSARFLDDLVPAFKIASGDNTFFPLIEVIAKTGKPIIMSTGLADIQQIIQSKSLIEDIWVQKNIVQELAILHCVSSYPVEPEYANLKAIKTLQELFDCTIGYSDHAIGINAALVAVGLGAKIIEKHFTKDKQFSDFNDHKLSVDPCEMKQLVQRIREIEQMLGSGEKILQLPEINSAIKIRRSIVAKRDLSAGYVLSYDDLSWVRPGDGLKPGSEDLLVGKTLKKPIKKGYQIGLEYIELTSTNRK